MATIGVNKRPEDFNFYGMTPGEGSKFQRLQGTGQVDNSILGVVGGLNDGNNAYFQAMRNGLTLAPNSAFTQDYSNFNGGAADGQAGVGVTPNEFSWFGRTINPSDYLLGRSTNFGDGPNSRFDDGLEMVNWYDNKGKNKYTDVINDPANMGKFTGGDLGLILSGLAAMGGLAMLPGGALSGAFGSGVGSGAGGIGAAAGDAGAMYAGLDGAAGVAGLGGGATVSGVGSALGGLEGLAGAAGVIGAPVASTAGLAAAGGGLSSLASLLPSLGGSGGLSSWLPLVSTVVGGLAGSKGTNKSVTETRELPEYLRGPVTGKNGLLSSADQLMQYQMRGTPMRGLLK